MSETKPTVRWAWCRRDGYMDAIDGQTETEAEARKELERRIGFPLGGCIEKVSGATTYYYLTKADVVRDSGKAYEGRITRVEWVEDMTTRKSQKNKPAVKDDSNQHPKKRMAPDAAVTEVGCEACATVAKDNIDGEPTHVDCGASESEHHFLITKERTRAEVAEKKLAEMEYVQMEYVLWDVMERLPGIYDVGARKGARERANALLDRILVNAAPKKVKLRSMNRNGEEADE